MLGSFVCDELNGFLKSRMPNFYRYEGIEFVAAALRNVDVVAAFLTAADNDAGLQSTPSDLPAEGV